MKGSYNIRVQNRQMCYDLTIRRNLTIIQGDSATGKTTLVSMIQEYEQNGEASAIQLQCQRPCMVIQGNNWQKMLSGVENSIVFIDEGNPFVSSTEFASSVKSSSNYYVIVTREPLYNLPYSAEEIYGIHCSGKYGQMRPFYHELYRIYPAADAGEKLVVDTVLTEDSHAGYSFFEAICPQAISCVSTGGNAQAFEQFYERKDHENCLLIADGAAFGPYMTRISQLIARHPSLHVYLPESFEWLILSSGLIDGNRIAEMIEHPEEYIESENYFSWEQFFTAKLVEETQGSWLRYDKARLNPAYLQKQACQTIICTMPKSIADLFSDVNFDSGNSRMD